MSNPVSGPASTDVSTDALAVALSTAEAAGELLLEAAGITSGGRASAHGMGRRQRSDAKNSAIDLVTEFDRRSEALIVGRLRAAFPADLIVGEEGGASAGTSGHGAARWLIDPIDGTTNFAHGLPFFTISIAREVDGAVDVGVVYAPALALRFAARRGGGATLNGEPIHVSDAASLEQSLLATGFPYDNHTSPDNNFAQFTALHRRAQGIRRVGSAAFDLALVAQGAFDGYWEMKLKPWDLAAGALLVTEAGGRVSGWRGEPLSVDRGAMVASNGRLHDAMLSVLAEHPYPSVV